MRRKSSKAVSLVLITATLAACSKPQENQEQKQRVYMRADSSAPYTEVTDQYQQQRSGGMGMGSAFLWYMAFRPMMGGGMGYTSQGIAPQSNVGNNTHKANAYAKTQSARGGFGKTATAKNSSASS
ncbi:MULTISPECIES: hypothetical protein [Myroides]|uniref:Lipoprotein n=1 Tax=Myroides phaeus TaxID=702745 RepID=A0A1G8C5B8_9FLAO|nr:hypothetical protein [Myroides phaeus]MEC4115471.1 hypothetical protein [Myroides phaeus]SDH40574.1 hypothetical protein SAMN05421818_103133 [Myroides phaeus]